MTKTCTCGECGKSEAVTFSNDDMADYQNGTPMQHAFGYLTPERRLLLVSDICLECFHKSQGGEQI